MNWFQIPSPKVAWLVDGLIPSDGCAAVCGKPKAGKSTFIRNLIACVIKRQRFIGRSIDLSTASAGSVLYLHLDRKDQPWRVAKELRDLGITEQESKRLTLRFAQDMPDSFAERLEWLIKEVITAKPNLVVIDLLWQFVVAKNCNDYNAVLAGINQLQDALTKAGYSGALVAALHGRKATNPNDPADDMLGSTGQRGSFSTNIMLTRYRKQKLYTILSEQTERDEHFGEIDETVIARNADGTLELGRPFTELVKEEKEVKTEVAMRRLLDFIRQNPGCEITELMSGLSMSKKHAKRLLENAGDMVSSEGKGVKGDPLRFYLTPASDGATEARRFSSTYGGLN
jgi:hypothetical protein